MFDIGFSEILLIGVVALVVIGPERLPKVARTAGLLFGRMQRYVSGMREEINRELQLEEVQRASEALRASMEAGVQSAAESFRQASNDVRQSVTTPAAAAGSNPAQEVSAVSTTASPVAGNAVPADVLHAEAPSPGTVNATSAPASLPSQEAAISLQPSGAALPHVLQTSLDLQPATVNRPHEAVHQQAVK